MNITIQKEWDSSELRLVTVISDEFTRKPKESDMLVTFTTDAYADIIMFGDVALTLLKMMRHSKTVPGAILAADVPMALNR